MFRRLFVLAVVLTQLSCSEANPYQEFDDAVNALVRERDLNGATAIIVHRDRGVLHVRGYGHLHSDRISLIASSSKVVSVGVIMRLVDQGVLDLDTPISTYLSPLYGEYKTNVTLAQMLSNSSGMLSLADNAAYLNYVCQYIHSGTMADCAKVIYTANDSAESVPPDTKFRYGGAQWQLAGGVASAVTGKSWEELVAETYAPCDLSTLAYNNHYQQAVVEGGIEGALSYPTFFGGDPENLGPTQNPSVEGGAYTDVRSYGEILLMHLRGGVCPNGRVLSEASVARMQQDRIGTVYGGSTGDSDMPGYGLGWWVSRDEPGVVADAGAFGALPFLDTERGYGVMVIVESTNDATSGLRAKLQPIVERILDRMEPSH